MRYPENTTQQLHYPAEGYGADESTTQAHLRVPMQSDPAAAGRVPVAPPTQLAAPGRPVPAPAPAAAPSSGRGLTTIAEDVVERVIQKVVDLTVAEVDGVRALRPVVDQFFHPADKPADKPAEGAAEGSSTSTASKDRSVAVTLTDGQATINLAIEVDFGFAVLEVVEQVRGSVIEQSERLLGLTVAEVNVVVSEVSFESGSANATDGSAKASTAKRTRT
jgi:uncharacterized alkaline shock family protein YloU